MTDPEGRCGALVRECVAYDPVYFEGAYEGSDRIYPADIPYGPDECVELTFIDYSENEAPWVRERGTSDFRAASRQSV